MVGEKNAKWELIDVGWRGVGSFTLGIRVLKGAELERYS